MSQSSRDWSYMGIFKVSIFWTWKKKTRKTNLSSDSIQGKHSCYVTFLLAPNTNFFTWVNSDPNHHSLVLLQWITTGSHSIHPGPALAQFSTLLAKGTKMIMALPFKSFSMSLRPTAAFPKLVWPQNPFKIDRTQFGTHIYWVLGLEQRKRWPQ